jgi:hypothetical protein
MWLPLFKRFRSNQTQANHSKTKRLRTVSKTVLRTYRPQLEALEDRTLLSPTLLYSYSTATGKDWAIALDPSRNAYLTGEGNLAGKLDSTGTSFQYLDYLRGGGGNGTAIALDSAGNIYVTGYPGPNFATTPNAFSTTPSYQFLSKLDPTGSNLLYSTYIPGSTRYTFGTGSQWPGSIAVDGMGNVYVTGKASSDFSTTPNAYQSAYPGADTTFLAEFNPALSGRESLVYGSFLGGALGASEGHGIALDSTGDAYVTGVTQASDFPVTPGAFQTVIHGGEDTFVAKFNTSLSGAASLVYSTFLGGSGSEDGLGQGPADLFNTSGPIYPCPAITVDSSGAAYVTGETNSSDFPTTPGAFDRTYIPTNPWGGDVYVTKLNAAGSALVYSTFLGGSGLETGTSIAVDPYGNATITGGTKSTNFPTSNPIQSTLQATCNAFVTTLNASGSGLLFSTYLGGANKTTGCGVVLDSSGNIYVTGGGYTATGYLSFVYKISAPVGPSFTVSGLPSTVTAGTSATVTVTALNADGSVNTSYSGTVHFTSSDPQAALPPDATLTNGTGTFTVILKTAGAQSITATDASNSSVAGSEGITVTPGTATHFIISGPASIGANTAFSITVTALDAYGNVATGYRGTIHFSDSVSGATLPGNYTFTASDNGVHTFTGLKLKTKGPQTITIVDVMNNTILGTFLINVT